MERQKAEELLSLPENRVGSFMVRESARERGEYSGVCGQNSLVGLWLSVEASVRVEIKIPLKRSVITMALNNQGKFLSLQNKQVELQESTQLG